MVSGISYITKTGKIDKSIHIWCCVKCWRWLISQFVAVNKIRCKKTKIWHDNEMRWIRITVWFTMLKVEKINGYFFINTSSQTKKILNLNFRDNSVYNWVR